MKTIQLTKGYSAMVDDADFEWLSKWKWYAASGGGNHVYAARKERIENGRSVCVLMHRQILGLVDPKILGEHADGNGLNNTRKNIRPCTKVENTWNSGSRKGSISRFKGVSWDRVNKKWVVTIMLCGKSKYFGSFENEEDAAREYNQLAKDNHGEFAMLNEVSPVFPERKWSPKIISSRNTSGFRGVIFDKISQKWAANISKNGKSKRLGLFSDPSEAAKSYDKAALELFGDLARLNF